MILRLAHMHTHILLGDTHRPGGDGEFGGQSGGVRRHTDGDDHPSPQVLGSSGPHGSLRLLKKPTEGGELLHGSQSPGPVRTVLGVTGATPKALAVAGRCLPALLLQHVHLRASAQGCSPPAEGVSPPGNGTDSGNPQNSPNSLTWFVFCMDLHVLSTEAICRYLHTQAHTYISVWPLVSANKDYKIQKII